MPSARAPGAAKATIRGVVCTIAHGPHRELLEISRPTLEKFADGNDYELVTVEHRLAPDRPAVVGQGGAPPPARAAVRPRALGRRRRAVRRPDARPRGRALASPVPAPRRASDRVRAHLQLRRDGAQRRRAVPAVPRAGVEPARPRAPRLVENAAVLRLLGYRLDPTSPPERLSPWLAGVGRLDGAWNSIPDCPSPDPVIAHFPAMTPAGAPPGHARAGVAMGGAARRQGRDRHGWWRRDRARDLRTLRPRGRGV